MKLALVWVFLAALGNAATDPPYPENELLYNKAMSMLEQQIQLLRHFVTEINRIDSLKSVGPIWRGISNVFTDLSSMFGNNGQQFQYESYGMLSPQVNASDLARKARLRMAQIRNDIVEMNDRISQLINDTFGSKPHGDDYKINQHQKDEPAANNEKANQTSSSLTDELLGFELSVSGLINRRLLKARLYQEEYDALNLMTPQQIGKLVKSLITQGQLNANKGQCQMTKLLDDEKPLIVEL